ncbi:MAG: efflux RND transporter periplasmic adaptor subunit [Bacteroidota bacterium]
MKRIALLLLITVIIASCDDESKDLSKDISVPVSVTEIVPSSLEEYISTTGTVNPVKEVTLKAEISGNYILLKNPKTGKHFVLGDYVKKGTKIIQIEDAEYENNIKIISLELHLEISKQVFDKQKSLYKKGGVTLSELKNSEIEYINSKYSYEDALIRLRKMKISAPFSGRIVELPYNTSGTKIDAGATMVVLMDYSNLLLELNIAVKNIDVINVGQEVRIMNYTIPDDTLAGFISQLSPAIDPQSRSFKAVVSINNKALLLRPGMFAKGEIIVASKDSIIVIPKNIILSKQRGNTVFVVEKGLAQERIITFGLENPEYVEVISGLEPKEDLVTKGFETLRNRSKVKVVK